MPRICIKEGERNPKVVLQKLLELIPKGSENAKKLSEIEKELVLQESIKSNILLQELVANNVFGEWAILSLNSYRNSQLKNTKETAKNPEEATKILEKTYVPYLIGKGEHPKVALITAMEYIELQGIQTLEEI